MLTITKGYVQALRFVVKRTFSVLSHMEVWCFEFQVRHNLMLRQSENLCFVLVQLKQSFFFESISSQFSTLFTPSTLTSFMTFFVTINTNTGGLSEKHLLCSLLCFWSLFNMFLGFLLVHLLNESTSFAKSHSCQLLSSLTRSALIPGNLSKVNLT